jgi:hypothetical protein
MSEKMTESSERRIMDFAASRLEKMLILGPLMSKTNVALIHKAIRMLRNPPVKGKGKRWRLRG